MLAIVASMTPSGMVSFVGDAGDDQLEIFVNSGTLGYSGATPDAPTLNIGVDNITALLIDLGGGSDSVAFNGAAPLAFANGRLDVRNVESIHVDQSLQTGGDLSFVSGQILIARSEVTLSSQSGGVVLGGKVNAAPAVAANVSSAVAPGADFLAWQRSLGKSIGATRGDGDYDGDGDVDGTDLSTWKAGFAAAAIVKPTEATLPGQKNVGGQQFLAWQRALGTTTGATAAHGDLDGDGDVDSPDLTSWKSAFIAASDAQPPVPANFAADGAAHLIVTAGGIVEFQQPVGESAALGSLEVNASRLKLGGHIRLGGNSLTFNSPVTLTNDLIINDTGDVTFVSTVDGDGVMARSLTVNTPGVTTFGGAVGGVTPLRSLMTDAGQTRLNGNLTLVGNSTTFNSPVVLTMNVTIVDAGNVTFNSTINGAFSLTVNSPGLTTFDGAVGGTAPLTNLTTDDPGQTQLGAAVTTTQNQTYGDDVILSANVTLAGHNVTFSKTVTGSFDLMVDTAGAGDTTFTGKMNIRNLTTDADGRTLLGTAAPVDVITAGDQTYGDALQLTGDAVLQGANVRFGGTINGAFSLTVNSPGLTTFDGAVGGTAPLTNLTTDDPGQTQLGAAVTTTQNQTYGDDVILSANVTLAGHNVTFSKTVTGSFDLMVDTAGAGDTTFTGKMNIRNLTTDADGRTLLGTAAPVDVITAGDQTYGDALQLTGDAVLQGANVRFGGTINGAFSLTVNSPGLTTFDGAVGGTAPLTNLTTDSGGETRLGAAPPVDVLTTGNQTYGDAVRLTGDAVLQGANVRFGGTVNGAFSLTVSSPGLTTFEGVVGGVNPLVNLTTNVGGQTRFNIVNAGVDITTTGDQRYNDPVTLLNHSSLKSGHDVTFADTVNGDLLGPWDLVVDADQFVNFNAAVGAVRRLRDLTVLTGGAFAGPFSLTVPIFVTRDVDVEVRESAAPLTDADDYRQTATGQITAGRDVRLKAGDDLTLLSGAVVDADGTLMIDGDFGDNDSFATTISMTTDTPMTTNAVGMVRGAAGIIIRGDDDSKDVFNLQAERFVTPAAVIVQGFRTSAAASGNDEFLLVFASNSALTVGSFAVAAGGDGDQDRITIDSSKDTTSRRVTAQYSTIYSPPPAPAIVNGSNATLTGLGTVSGFSATGMEKYFFKAGSAVHDFFLIQTKDQTIPASPDAAYLNHEQRATVSDNPLDFNFPLIPNDPVIANYQWIIQGWESGQLLGSNVRDAILNHTSVPMLIEGFGGNDTLVGGSSLDVIFSGAGAPFFRVGANDDILRPPYVAALPNPPEGVVGRGDTLIGAGGNDFLFADIDLFRDASFLWGLVTLDVAGEADLLNGAGFGSTAITQTDHAAQFGTSDMVRNITGMLVDGGAQKDVFTWLLATPMSAVLNPNNTSDQVNMLIDAAFRANNPAIGKVGLLSPPFNALLSDFVIPQRTFPPPSAAPLMQLATSPPAASLSPMDYDSHSSVTDYSIKSSQEELDQAISSFGMVQSAI